MVEKITEIPALPIEKMHQIGSDYLAAHPEPSFSHDNHPFAEKLQTFSKSATDVEKWQTLFDMYHQLKSGGTLKSNIAALVNEHFKADISGVSRAFTYQRGVSSIWLWHIGNQYLNQHPERDDGLLLFHSHTNQPMAKALMDNSKAYTGKKAWIYLYLMYQRLPNEKGSLATNIRQIFSTQFHDSFENTVRELGLDSYTEKSLRTLPDDALDLSLSREVEERFYQQQIEQIFQIKIPELSSFEEASVFWYKRQPYVKMVAAGVIIIAPVASVLFLTANIYALLFMGIVAGGGTLVLELVGQAAFKVEHVPDSVWELMRKNQEEFGLNNIRFRRSLEEQLSQLNAREIQLSKQELLLGEQSQQLGSLEKNVALLSGIAAQLSQSLSFSSEQQAQFVANLKEVCSQNSEIAAKAMANMSGIAKQNQVLASSNQSLKGEVSRLGLWLTRLESVVKSSASNAERQARITEILGEIAQKAGVITGHVAEAHALTAVAAQAHNTPPAKRTSCVNPDPLTCAS